MTAIVILAMIAAVAWIEVRDYRHSPRCRWCHMRHRGRCIYNPRSGRFFANTRDGHFDYNDPDK